MSIFRIARSLAPALVLAAGAASAQEMIPTRVEVLEARTTATTARQGMADVYALFVNVETNETLTGVDSPVAGRVDLVTGDGKKRPYGNFRFEDDTETGFRPNEQHLRLVGLKRALVRGESVPVTLHFQSGFTLALDIKVQ